VEKNPPIQNPPWNKIHRPRSADSGSTVASDGRTRKCLVTDVSWEEGCDSCVRYAFVCSLNLLIGSRVNSGASSLQLVIRTLLFSGVRWFDNFSFLKVRWPTWGGGRGGEEGGKVSRRLSKVRRWLLLPFPLNFLWTDIHMCLCIHTETCVCVYTRKTTFVHSYIRTFVELRVHVNVKTCRHRRKF
jgi:hypothetical protein